MVAWTYLSFFFYFEGLFMMLKQLCRLVILTSYTTNVYLKRRLVSYYPVLTAVLLFPIIFVINKQWRQDVFIACLLQYYMWIVHLFVRWCEDAEWYIILIRNTPSVLWEYVLRCRGAHARYVSRIKPETSSVIYWNIPQHNSFSNFPFHFLLSGLGQISKCLLSSCSAKHDGHQLR